MKKFLLTFTSLALALTTANASVVINETNFPDENLRQRVTDLDSNGDGVLTDDELSQYLTSLTISNVTNLKGLELLSYFTGITLSNSTATEINPAYLPSTLKSLGIEEYQNLESLDLSSLQNLEYLDIRYCPELKGLDFNQYKSLNSIYLSACNSIQDIALSDMPRLTSFSIYPSLLDEEKWSINSISVSQCPSLNVNFSNVNVKVNRFTVSGVNSIYGGGEVNSLTISDCPNIESLELTGSVDNLTLTNLPQLNTFKYTYGNIANIIGLEQLPELSYLTLTGYGATALHSSNLPSQLKQLSLDQCVHLTSVNLEDLQELTQIEINNCEHLASLEMPAVIQTILLENCPSLTELDLNKYQHLQYVELGMCGMKDIVISNKEDLGYFSINRNTGRYDSNYKWSLNTIKVTDCPASIVVNIVKAKKLTVSNVGGNGYSHSFSGIYSEIDSVDISNYATTGISFSWDSIPYMELKGMHDLMSLNVSESKVEKLVVEDCPSLREIVGYGNRLSWLDLSSVVYHADWGENGQFLMNDQNVDVQAVKISPTEVGLRVDPRLDVSKVQDLTAKGEAMQAKEIFVDGIRYFVFYNNGPQTESLVGAEGNGYRYNTGWPYPWIFDPENPFDYEKSKDNLMPVTLHVTGWTKHQAFLKLSTNRVSGVYGEPLTAPVLTRSQDYDGKVTFTSSNESVVKVDAETGALTVVGAGTATISVSGAETDYRLAPATLTYSVFIDKAQPVIAFPAAVINATYGDEYAPENRLNVTWYEGAVNYISADPAKATVSGEGTVSILGAGNVTISGIAPETANFYPAETSYELRIAKASPVFAFEKDDLTVNLGEEVPENVLNTGLYDGEVVYTLSTDTVVSIDAYGTLSVLGAGEVIVTAMGAATDNCNEPVKAGYKLTVIDPTGIRSIAIDETDSEAVFDLLGRRVQHPVRKGIYIIGNRKVIFK